VRSTHNKATLQQSNQFPMDKIKSCTTISVVHFDISRG